MDFAAASQHDFLTYPTHPSPTTGAISASPALRALAPAAPDYDAMLAPATDRIISLGGMAMPVLSAFTVSARLRGRDFLCDTDFTPDEIAELLDTAARLKGLLKRGEPHAYLAGKTLGMLFQHPSTRTRVSLEAGMAQLGGHALFLTSEALQMKRGETIPDTAKILGSYLSGIAARVASHDVLTELAEGADVPVYNALSDKYHPMQALSDMLTLQEQFGSLAGLKLVFIGDGSNNMAASLLLAGAAMGVHVTIASPQKYQPDPEVITRARWLAGEGGHNSGASIQVTDDPYAAMQGADAIYADVHVSLGMADGAARAVTLAPFKVTEDLMAAANPGAVFMHCLPMHRGEEVDAEVADGSQSVIFTQAENRLHVQKALLLQTMA